MKYFQEHSTHAIDETGNFMRESGHGISSIEFDSFWDLMWVGQQNGRITSYNISESLALNEIDENHHEITPCFTKYSSFQPSTSSGIIQLLPNVHDIVSITNDSMYIHGYGGMKKQSPIHFEAEECTCAIFLREPNVLANKIVQSNQVVVGFTNNTVSVYDIQSLSNQPIVSFLIPSIPVKIVNNGHKICVAGSDGKIYLLDGKLRSRGVIKSLEAYSGAIKDIELLPDDKTLWTCGYKKLFINRYDPNSPFQLVGDPGIRVFDIRTQQPMPPILTPSPLSRPGSLVHSIRHLNTLSTDRNAPAAMLQISNDGIIQIDNLIDNPIESSTSKQQILYSPLNVYDEYNSSFTATPNYVTSVGSSLSGNYFTVGCAQGYFTNFINLDHPTELKDFEMAGPYLGKDEIHPQSALFDHMGTSQLQSKPKSIPKCNENSPNCKVPPPMVPNPPYLSLKVDSMVMGTAFVLCPPRVKVKEAVVLTKNYTERQVLREQYRIQRYPPTSSSFLITPQLYHTKLKLTSSRVIHPNIRSKMIKQDFLGVLHDSDFRPNSTLYGKNRALAYIDVDPRKLDLSKDKSQGRDPGKSSTSSNPSKDPKYLTDRQKNHRKPLTETHLPSAVTDSRVSLADRTINSSNASDQKEVPSCYKKSISRRGKNWIKKFNYKAFNSTDFVGLENNMPNSYVNAALQLLYFVAPIRKQALLSQQSTYHHINQTTLWCELGFLFHMMNAVRSSISHSNDLINSAQEKKKSDSLPTCPNVVRPVNFIRTYQLIPEAVALGLLDNTINPVSTSSEELDSKTSPLDLQSVIQSFCKFLLSQLNKECDGSDRFIRGNNISELNANQSKKEKQKPKKKQNHFNLISDGDNIQSNVGAKSPVPSGSNDINSIDEVFGFSQQSETRFLHSQSLEIGSNPIRSFSIDLLYPIAINVKSTVKHGKSTATSGRSNTSFAAILWSSLQKELYMRGWCAASDSYEPFRQTRKLLSVPRILSIMCGDTRKDVFQSEVSSGISLGSILDIFWANETVSCDYLDRSVLDGYDPDLDNDDTIMPTVRSKWCPVAVEICYQNEEQEGAGSQQQSPPPSKGFEEKMHLIDSKKGDVIKLLQRGGHRLIVSALLTSSHSTSSSPLWLVFDGVHEMVTRHPASHWLRCQSTSDTDSSTPLSPESAAIGEECEGQFEMNHQLWSFCQYDLSGVISQISDSIEPHQTSSHPLEKDAKPSEPNNDHLVFEMRRFSNGLIEMDGVESSGVDNESHHRWLIFNDFTIMPCEVQDVINFAHWKQPCVIVFTTKSHFDLPPLDLNKQIPSNQLSRVPDSVLQINSLSQMPTISIIKLFGNDPNQLPGEGDLIAFDGEFVSVSLEKTVLTSSGQREVSEEARQVLARISLLMLSDEGQKKRKEQRFDIEDRDLNNFVIIADDYILPVEPVVDYVTRFSGISPEDLHTLTTKHSLISTRAAYLKLRYFVDNKCIFVGHGLEKDIETANLYIPPSQIRDTVDLWRLPHQRKISLRFLAHYLLHEDIQDEIHDSVEDAKTALRLYLHYENIVKQGAEVLQETLHELYKYGNSNNWTIGLDRLE